MSRTEKYNFIVNKNQFHKPVPFYYEDPYEVNLINWFEETVLELKEKKRLNYTMIELGSNQCYYSLLFKHILGKENTFNVMVEPVEENLNVGKEQFELNDCKGVFYHKGIGSFRSSLFIDSKDEITVPSITLEEILHNDNLSHIDVLHSDIDGSEITLLQDNEKTFKDLKISHIFFADSFKRKTFFL